MKVVNLKVIFKAASVGLFLVLAGTAGAATCTPTSGNGNSNKALFLTSTLNGTNADAFCSQSGWDKNDTPSEIALRSPFGEDGWIQADKDTEAVGDQMIVLTTTGAGTATEANKGTWSLSTTFVFEKLMITLKDGAGWGAFLLDPADRAGNWWSQEGSLSHSTVWYVGKSDPVNPVPLPAAGWLLLAGLGGLFAARRRRKFSV